MNVGRYSTFRLDVAAPDNILYGNAVRSFRSHLSVHRFRIVTVPVLVLHCETVTEWEGFVLDLKQWLGHEHRADSMNQRTEAIRNTTLCD